MISPAFDGTIKDTASSATISNATIMLNVEFERFQVAKAVCMVWPWTIRTHVKLLDWPMKDGICRKMTSPMWRGITGTKDNSILVGAPAFLGLKFNFVLLNDPT